MIELKHVSFTYQGQTGDGLHDINLTIEDGECVLFCGRSGCGKTTMINLLMRFYDTDEGEIRVDGVPLGREPEAVYLMLNKPRGYVTLSLIHI